jgi:hypothetical protein
LKFCIHCGTQLDDAANFCTSCGANPNPVDVAATTPEAGAPVGAEPSYATPAASEPVPSYEQFNAQTTERYNPVKPIITLALGIASLSLCWAYGIFGIGCGIAGMILAGKCAVSNPGSKMASVGRKLSLAGIIISAVSAVIWLIVLIVSIAENY